VWAASLAGLSLLPDVDVLAFRLGVPYSAPFGHRGALHSIVFAVATALVLGFVARRLELPALSTILVCGLVVASHGVLDAFTDGGLGVALLWPFRSDRYFAPWRPIPVAPIGWRLLSTDGLALMARECALFLPVFVVGLWPRREPSRPR
jgi:inner membrane protein